MRSSFAAFGMSEKPPYSDGRSNGMLSEDAAAIVQAINGLPNQLAEKVLQRNHDADAAYAVVKMVASELTAASDALFQAAETFRSMSKPLLARKTYEAHLRAKDAAEQLHGS